MSMVVQKCDRYLVNYIGGTTLQGKGSGATIQCYNGNQMVGLIEFFADHVTMPANSTANGQVILYYEMSRFGDVMNILRYEKPLMLAVNNDTKFGYIGTSTTEPVGEEEPHESYVLTAQ